jgi:hypothetical protein
MSQPVEIIGSSGSKKGVFVTERGELVTGRISYSTPYYIKVAASNTAYEVARGKAGKQFVITDVLIASDKNFASATTGEPIAIYGAHPSDLDTVLDVIFQVELLKNDRLVATGLNLITEEACSIVAFAATDAAVDVTIAGYYVDA